MSIPQSYDERAVVLAYLDAQRPGYPHEDFRTFRRAKVSALQAIYRIEISYEGVAQKRLGSLWMLFDATAESFLKLGGPREGFLEDSAINSTIERIDNPQLALRQTEATLHHHLEQAREAHVQLLTRLFRVLWGPIEKPCSSADLAKLGFDASAEPKLSDYYDYM
jgi:hypothetical protein